MKTLLDVKVKAADLGVLFRVYHDRMSQFGSNAIGVSVRNRYDSPNCDVVFFLVEDNRSAEYEETYRNLVGEIIAAFGRRLEQEAGEKPLIEVILMREAATAFMDKVIRLCVPVEVTSESVGNSCLRVRIYKDPRHNESDDSLRQTITASLVYLEYNRSNDQKQRD